ncbi:hypothetical protein DPMN_156315 [Dreissena polymorpha]|uniref:Uncharacterized protein n=1 Tax=Dreissena polymorpha TaxID=45954 RepID=A0A9D4I8B1_DREPO|nr:hypothetical protein DPMN_186598 [Dreissena polymorpha]KAH3802637.1 hypothetical protein DPMN_156315 [Dreissena polymorpha]
MPSLRSQSGWGTRLLVDFELLEVCNEAAFVQYSAILQAVCLKLEIYIADINDVVYVLVTTDLHMIPVGEHPESQFPHSLQQMFPGRVVAILQAVCLKLEIYIADINDVVYVLVTTDLHMIPVGEHPESQFPHSLQQMFPGRVVALVLQDERKS